MYMYIHVYIYTHNTCMWIYNVCMHVMYMGLCAVTKVRVIAGNRMGVADSKVGQLRKEANSKQNS